MVAHRGCDEYVPVGLTPASADTPRTSNLTFFVASDD
jgi:hypothetical protein